MVDKRKKQIVRNGLSVSFFLYNLYDIRIALKNGMSYYI